MNIQLTSRTLFNFEREYLNYRKLLRVWIGYRLGGKFRFYHNLKERYNELINDNAPSVPDIG